MIRIVQLCGMSVEKWDWLCKFHGMNFVIVLPPNTAHGIVYVDICYFPSDVLS